MRDFRLGGAHLPPAEKERFLQIQEELSALSSTFNDNLLDATNNFALHVRSAEELTGIPEDALQMAQAVAEKEGATGWKFSLHAPSYLPVMQYADSRALREKLYRAYSTRASETEAPGVLADTAGKYDNTPLIRRILELRKEEARILGFDCYAEVSLVSKMASTPQQVLDFLNELAARARPYAERDLAELREFAATRLGLEEMEAWDVAYVSEKLRIDRYAFSDQEVKQYLPGKQRIAGHVQASAGSLWHYH